MAFPKTNVVDLAIVVVCFAAFGSVTYTGRADERLWLDAEINGKAVRLCFDSGADTFILWRSGAERLGLKWTEPATNTALASGKVPGGTTEECTLLLVGMKGKTRFRVLDLPKYVYVNFDGVIGWWGLRENILQIDASAQRVEFLEKVPKKTAGWTQFRVATNSSVLELELPSDSGTKDFIYVDTGSDCGLALPPHTWQAWKTAHAHQPMTFNTFFTPDAGLVAKEEAWADKFSLGSLVLTGVPVTEALPTEVQTNESNCEGTLGLAALKRLDFIIDGAHGVAYLRPKSTHPPLYKHNRLGAAFVPDSKQGDELIARVADGSPAQAAGVRNGDVLLEVDGVKVTKLNPAGLRSFFLPAGTKINLTLKHDRKIFKAAATLREILSPFNQSTK